LAVKTAAEMTQIVSDDTLSSTTTQLIVASGGMAAVNMLIQSASTAASTIHRAVLHVSVLEANIN